METIIGIKGKDFIMLAADSTHPHSIMVLKDGNLLVKLNVSNQFDFTMIRQFFFLAYFR